MIIYIHGFGGSGQGIKSRAFREYFKSINEPFISPSLSYIPELAISTLEELIASYENVTLIGSSLGGYYSIYLSQKYNLKAVLINPSIYPFVTLDNYKGDARSFYDEGSFKWTSTHIEMLTQFQVDTPKEELLMLLVQKGDELLDYQKALEFLPNARHIVEDGGDHSFTGIEKQFEKVSNFLL